MAGYGQPRKGAAKRTVCVNTRFSPAEAEIIDKANAAEMPGKPRGAYVRYAALQHCAGVDTSILELRAERWYYYSRDKYGREVCYTLDGAAARSPEMQSKVTDYSAADYQITPAMYNADDITPAKAQRRGMHALAALLRAEAAEQGK